MVLPVIDADHVGNFLTGLSVLFRQNRTDRPYASLWDQEIYDKSSIPDAETRNVFPALSRESPASVTTALATSSVVTFAPIFWIKSAGERPREEAYASIAAFPSSVSGMMRPGVSARNCKPSCKRADSFWA